MTPVKKFWSATMAAVSAFRESWFSSNLIDPDDWADLDARQLRYQILWAMYENTAYRDIHAWAASFRQTMALYKYIRSIFNPAYRLCEFHRANIWGGSLDMDAGDGNMAPSALPIITDNETIRPAIAKVWQWSNWDINKDLVTLWGTVLGDVGLKIIDDADRGQVYLEIVHPSTITELVTDVRGNVKGYGLEYEREDENGDFVVYGEEAIKDGQTVTFLTYKDGEPWDWWGYGSQWDSPFGFVPFVTIKHNDVGLAWGWSEMQPSRAKFSESDELASMLHDQIRKTVNPKWAFFGARPEKGSSSVSFEGRGASDTTDRPEPGREETHALYFPKESAKAQAMTANIPLASVTQQLTALMEEIERDYPELRFDRLRAGGEVSGRALRVARQPAERKILQRRVNYDGGLVRALQMAMTIGGYRKIEGFAPFGLESYSRGALDFQVGSRPVFATDILDQLEEKGALWSIIERAVKTGAPLDGVLAVVGELSEEDIDMLMNTPMGQQQQAMAQMALAVGPGPGQEEEEEGTLEG